MHDEPRRDHGLPVGLIRSPLAIVALAGLIAAGAMGVVAMRADASAQTEIGTESPTAIDPDVSERIAELEQEREDLTTEANALRRETRQVRRKLASFEREVARQERRIRALRSELASLDA